MDPLNISRPADDEGVRAIVDRMNRLSDRLSELGAMVSQITSTTGTNTVTPWLPPTSYSDVVTIELPRPLWAESVIVLASGHVAPRFDPNAGTPYCYSRMRIASTSDGAPTETISPEFFTWLGSVDTVAGLSWPTLIRRVTGPVTVATQAQAPGAVAILGGSASVSATALWMR